MHLYFIQDFVCAASKNKTIFQARCKWTNLTFVYWRNKNKHRTRISEIFRSRHKFKSKHLFIRFILRETLCCCLFNFFTWPYSADTVTSTDLHLQPKFWYFFHEMSLMVFPTVYSNHFVALLLAVYFQSRYVCVRLPYQVSAKIQTAETPPSLLCFFHALLQGFFQEAQQRKTCSQSLGLKNLSDASLNLPRIFRISSVSRCNITYTELAKRQFLEPIRFQTSPARWCQYFSSLWPEQNLTIKFDHLFHSFNMVRKIQITSQKWKWVEMTGLRLWTFDSCNQTQFKNSAVIIKSPSHIDVCKLQTQTVCLIELGESSQLYDMISYVDISYDAVSIHSTKWNLTISSVLPLQRTS